MRKRQPMLAIGFAALVATGLGCGGESAPSRTSAKILRADEVKIKLGPDAPAKTEAAAEKPASSSEAPQGS